VARAGTRIYVQGGCDALSRELSLPHGMMRAELGSPFALQADDFPLRLSVLARGSHA
jgi:hypothetical protein